jgi:hypothetical protein
MNLENWIRNKLQEVEEMHDYEVGTETVRCWIDLWKDSKKSNFNPKELKVGDILIATNLCKNSLSIECSYIVKKVGEHGIEIDANYGAHSFSFDVLHKFFRKHE